MAVFSVIGIGTFLLTPILAIVTLLSLRAIYNLHFHRLSSQFPGPWYTAVSSLPLAIISYRRREPEWIQNPAYKYGTDCPIRIAPKLLVLLRPEDLREIYADPKCNTKSEFYNIGVLGPKQLFSTMPADEHRESRAALGGKPWTIGSLKNTWEVRIDQLIALFINKMSERAGNKMIVDLGDKMGEFASDFLTIAAFTDAWGFVQNDRDERGILANWLEGLDMIGFMGRSEFVREYILKNPLFSRLLPKMSDESGMGYLMSKAQEQLNLRESQLKTDTKEVPKDFLQHCIDARLNGSPLTQEQKFAHVVLLIGAGALTTGTALSSTLRFLAMNPGKLLKVQTEIDEANLAGELSNPVQYDEYVRDHFISAKAEVTSYSFVIQRDPKLYTPDPDVFRPERWLESAEKAAEMEAGSLFSMLRRFDFEVVDEGQFIVSGGIAYNKGFKMNLHARQRKENRLFE
ncbi:cytochrome P450 17A1 [Leptodontidium sp. MPI-SDFR-AT-0119]|nr:cytochrome P450 17A1 [Leptodontidium sp. MPI-SDFR-AT-0119]